MRMELDILPLPPSHQLHPQKVFFFSVTPGKNKLFRKNEFLTNGRLHENRGIKSFSQLRDERMYFIIVQARVEHHRPSQTTKSAKKLANLVVWLGLYSSALAWTMTNNAHLGVG